MKSISDKLSDSIENLLNAGSVLIGQDSLNDSYREITGFDDLIQLKAMASVTQKLLDSAIEVLTEVQDELQAKT
jgi:hypothetical protein